MGRLYVIEGLDGSGKATQAGLLTGRLKAAGQRVRQVSFPDYASESSALIRMYLRGDMGTKPDDVNAYAASSFFAVDRFASFRCGWAEDWREGVVVADRYTTSNAVHQCAKLERRRWDAFLDWLFDFEYAKLAIPAPDLVIYLRVDPAVSQRLMTGRYHGHEEKKDIHEKDMEYLLRCREAADYCAEKLGWRVVECCRGNEMRTAEEIHEDVARAVAEFSAAGRSYTEEA